ncbi:MAG: outer membrane lipoprotein-sorting protein [Sphaerochaetaceae bacterium]
MSNRTRIITIILFCLLCSSAALSAITAEEIIKTMDGMQTFDTSYSTGSIKTTDRFGAKESTFKAWSQGSSDSLIEFTSVAERGQKILRTKGSLYLFYPDAEELIRLQGAALRQSLLGSDLSYEDMTEEKNTLDKYTVRLDGSEIVNGYDCHVLTLTAKTRQVSYPIQKIWVDKQTYLVWKATYSTAQGRLLKEMEVQDTIVVDGRTLPKQTKIEDKLKRDSFTIMVLDTLEVNILLDRRIFTLENLTW